MKHQVVHIPGTEGVRSFTLHRTECATERMRGLLGRPRLADDEILLIKPCNAVHTFGMRYAIDVVFTDRRGRITKIVHRVSPGRFAMSITASQVFELSAGTAQRMGFAAGQTLPLDEGGIQS
ncbi:MAG: DUF192 domain-containing protein [Burkholderiales bacterium]|nr:DUF192 domain-containing protein [Burkholderiales bacterium]